MPFKFAPLKKTLLLTSIIGFLISTIYLPKISKTWAFTLAVIFIIIFIASLISTKKTR